MTSSMKATIEVMPEGSMEVLSQHEVERLRRIGEKGSHHELLRRCSLAVLNVGSTTDSAREVLEQYRDFDVRVVQQDRGIKLALVNPPAAAFVGGEMIRGIRELLFAVLRDILYISSELTAAGHFDLATGDGVTNAVFHILRNAGIFRLPAEPDLVVCWGGHAISREEYDYCKDVGYRLGLRKLNVCTGCGAGAMKGPMKGAALAHAKQRIHNGRYVGLTEPGIIAAESPNPIVNELVIMPDMEKRLEAFVRIAHAIVIFPGGVGTAEELLFLLGIIMHPDNRDIPLPLILTGPASSRSYFEKIDEFIGATLGREAQQRYTIIPGDADRVAERICRGIQAVRDFRASHGDAFYFNWHLTIDPVFQEPFAATHENMLALQISPDLESHVLAANLRRAFSGLVSGNIRDEGIRAIQQHGPFAIRGDVRLMQRLDTLLSAFVAQRRMRLDESSYQPCYTIIQ